MPQEGAFVATVYAPIMFPPAPILAFTQDKHTSEAYCRAHFSFYPASRTSFDLARRIERGSARRVFRFIKL